MLTRLAALLLAFTSSLSIAQNQPVFIYEQLLDTYFDDTSGLISFGTYDLAFPPDAPFNAAVAVVNSENTVVESFPFFPDYKNKEGAFARAMVQGPADVTLTEPGVYNIVFLVDGQPATRLAVALEQTSAGDDPFDPEKTYRFYGLWQVYAHLTMSEWKGEDWPILSFWAGSRDLTQQDAFTEPFSVTLTRDGETIAHSKKTENVIRNGHYKRLEVKLYEPHTEKETPNAVPFTRAGWIEDGDYELIVTRAGDGKEIRRFVYTAKDGKIGRLPQTDLGHEPRLDAIVPRVRKKGSTGFEFVEAIWLQQKPAQATP